MKYVSAIGTLVGILFVFAAVSAAISGVATWLNGNSFWTTFGWLYLCMVIVAGAEALFFKR